MEECFWSGVYKLCSFATAKVVVHFVSLTAPWTSTERQAEDLKKLRKNLFEIKLSIV